LHQPTRQASLLFPQHALTAQEIAEAATLLRDRIAKLEAENAELRSRLAPAPALSDEPRR